MFEKPKNQDLSTNSFGNRVHNTNRKPVEGIPLSEVDSSYVNPRNNSVTAMVGMGKDSDRTISHKWKKEGSDYMVAFRKAR